MSVRVLRRLIIATWVCAIVAGVVGVWVDRDWVQAAWCAATCAWSFMAHQAHACLIRVHGYVQRLEGAITELEHAMRRGDA